MASYLSALPFPFLSSLQLAMRAVSLLLLVALASLAGVTTVSARLRPRPHPRHAPPPPARDWSSSTVDPVGPSTYCITWETNVANATSPIVIQVNRTMAPLGADRLYALLQDNFFDFAGQPAAFFRVVPQFVVQFGIAGAPAENTKWNVVIPVSDRRVI